MVITWENVVASAEKYKKKEYYNKIKKNMILIGIAWIV